MTTNLNNLKVTELKEMAKELKIKNWWTLKKAELITELEKLQQPEVIDITEGEDTPIPQEGPQTEEPQFQEEPKEEADEDILTLKEIILELGIKGTKARRILRNSDIERPYKRWEWDKNKHEEIIKQVIELLSK